MGSKTLNNFFYKLAYGAKGIAEHKKYVDNLDVADAQIKANKDGLAGVHTQGTDQGLDTGGANAVIVADVKDAVTKKHSQNTDTHLGTVDQDIPMNTHKLTGLSVPSASGQSVRTTATITEANLEDGIDKKHSQNTDTDLDATFEATFAKKADTVNVLSDITSPGADIEDAVTKKHSANADTDLDATFEATIAKKADKLSVFAATTSAELAGVISDETGTGALVFGTSPTFKGNVTIYDVTDLGAEIHTQANAASDPNGNEADATTGWNGTGVTVTSVTTDPQTGTYHLKGVGADGSADRMEYDFTAVIGKKYYISFWAKRGAQGTVQKVISWEGLTPSPDEMITSSWARYTYEVTATATAAKIRIYVAVTGGEANDEVYVDNVSIKEVIGGNVNITGNLRITPKTPATAAAAGDVGTIRWDANYIYICIATNTWKKVAIATW